MAMLAAVRGVRLPAVPSREDTLEETQGVTEEEGAAVEMQEGETATGGRSNSKTPVKVSKRTMARFLHTGGVISNDK